MNLPSGFKTFVELYTDGTDANSLEAFIDLMGFDLTDFNADCYISVYCDTYFYENRYDGLAFVHYIGTTF